MTRKTQSPSAPPPDESPSRWPPPSPPVHFDGPPTDYVPPPYPYSGQLPGSAPWTAPGASSVLSAPPPDGPLYANYPPHSSHDMYPQYPSPPDPAWASLYSKPPQAHNALERSSSLSQLFGITDNQDSPGEEDIVTKAGMRWYYCVGLLLSFFIGILSLLLIIMLPELRNSARMRQYYIYGCISGICLELMMIAIVALVWFFLLKKAGVFGSRTHR